MLVFQGLVDTYILPPIANPVALSLDLELGGAALDEGLGYRTLEEDLALVGAHVAAAMKVGGAGREELGALAGVPLYVVKKAAMLPTLLRASRREHEWVRTARD